MSNPCSIEGCTRPRKSRELCGTHYERWRTTGTTELHRRPKVQCAVADCVSDALAKGLCNRHYKINERHGTPTPYRPTVEDRLIAGSTELPSGCRAWGVAGKNGYGSLSVSNRAEYVHRLAYEVWLGPIPPDMTIDHLCRVRLCINPDHLEVVTRAENTRRELEVRYA